MSIFATISDRIRHRLARRAQVRASAYAWSAATTVDHLRELTAKWLEGTVAHHPGYFLDCETLEIADDLAAINRAGLLTMCSQPGNSGHTAPDGAVWEQRPAVEGLCTAEVATAIKRLFEHTPAIVITDQISCTPFPQRNGLVVTLVDGRNWTWFGDTVPLDGLASEFRWCSDDVIDQFVGMWQVTVIWPAYNDSRELWNIFASLTASVQAVRG
jgi:hypothetical protein